MLKLLFVLSLALFEPPKKSTAQASDITLEPRDFVLKISTPKERPLLLELLDLQAKLDRFDERRLTLPLDGQEVQKIEHMEY